LINGHRTITFLTINIDYWSYNYYISDNQTLITALELLHL